MSSETNIIIVLVAIGSVAFFIISHWFRSRFLLKQWAKINGFELVKMRIPWCTAGPFLASKRQEVYQIRVRDPEGRERSGWAMCGGFWLGFLVDNVEVEWDTVHKAKQIKKSTRSPKTIKAQVAKVVNFVCKWAVIGLVTVIFLFIRWWARHHH